MGDRVTDVEMNRRSFLKAAGLVPSGAVNLLPESVSGGGPSEGQVTASLVNASGANPMHGFWPHTWYFDNQTGARSVGAVEPIIDALGTPAVIGNSVGKGWKRAGGWSALRGDREWMLTRVAPTAETPWNHMALTHPMVPWSAVHAAPGENEVDRRRHVLEEAAGGGFDDHYRQFARTLRDHDLADKVIVRLGPEHNGVIDEGGWQPASAIGNEGRWKRAFRRFAEQTWRVDPRILIGFSPAIQHDRAIVDRTWPGREYVDYLAFSGIHDSHNLYGDERRITGERCEFGVDCGERRSERIAERVWERYETGERWGDTDRFGLDDAAAYSARYDLPIALPEWGLQYRHNEWSGNDNPWFVRKFWEWCREHNVHWQTYFEAYQFDGAFLHNAEDLQRSLAAYQDTFSRGTGMDFIEPYRRKRAKDRPV